MSSPRSHTPRVSMWSAPNLVLEALPSQWCFPSLSFMWQQSWAHMLTCLFLALITNPQFSQLLSYVSSVPANRPLHLSFNSLHLWLPLLCSSHPSDLWKVSFLKQKSNHFTLDEKNTQCDFYITNFTLLARWKSLGYFTRKFAWPYLYLLFLHHVFLCFPAMVVIPQGYNEPWSVLPSTTGPLHRLFFCWNYFVYGLMVFAAIPLPPLIPNSMIFYSEKISFFHFLCFGFVFNLEWEYRTYICCFLAVRSGALGRWGR